jgi:hypothetical protein
MVLSLLGISLPKDGRTSYQMKFKHAQLLSRARSLHCKINSSGIIECLRFEYWTIPNPLENGPREISKEVREVLLQNFDESMSTSNNIAISTSSISNSSSRDWDKVWSILQNLVKHIDTVGLASLLLDIGITELYELEEVSFEDLQSMLKYIKKIKRNEFWTSIGGNGKCQCSLCSVVKRNV